MYLLLAIATRHVSVDTTMYRTPDRAQQLLCSRERIVHLQLSDADKTSLYVHPVILKAWSSVLGGLLDSVGSDGQQASDSFCSIPLTDSDSAAWEAALALMHPCSKPEDVMTCANAAGLLRLAHKYDMPILSEQVIAFLEAPLPYSSQQQHRPGCSTTRLEKDLTSTNARSWLELFSSCSYERQAQTCISYMTGTACPSVLTKPLELSYLNSLQPKPADQLLAGLGNYIKSRPSSTTRNYYGYDSD